MGLKSPVCPRLRKNITNVFDWLPPGFPLEGFAGFDADSTSLTLPMAPVSLVLTGKPPRKMLGRSVDRTAGAGWITAVYENLGSQRILATRLGRKHQGLPFRSTSGGNRTPNRRFWRPVLYQLSYARSTREAESRRGTCHRPDQDQSPIQPAEIGSAVAAPRFAHRSFAGGGLMIFDWTDTCSDLASHGWTSTSATEPVRSARPPSCLSSSPGPGGSLLARLLVWSVLPLATAVLLQLEPACPTGFLLDPVVPVPARGAFQPNILTHGETAPTLCRDWFPRSTPETPLHPDLNESDILQTLTVRPGAAQRGERPTAPRGT